MPAVQDQVTQIIEDSSSLVTEMKPVVRESLKNLDEGMLKTLKIHALRWHKPGVNTFALTVEHDEDRRLRTVGRGSRLRGGPRLGG